MLDTNVVSEPLKRHANPAVAFWLDRQPAESLYLTTISLSKLLLGVELLPLGRRRDGLGAGLSALVARLFGGRLVPFDGPAATAFARVIGAARASGNNIGLADGQIAAIAASRGFSVATRHTRPFASLGLAVIDPWSQPA